MRACIFDLDGTLTDTLDSLVYSVNMTLKEMGLPVITRAQCESFVGNGARVLVETSLKAAGDKNADRLEEGIRIYGRIFQENCTYHVTPYEGIMDLLAALKKQQVKLAVLSNKPHQQTVDVVRDILGDDIFTCVQGQCEGIPRKPDPSGVYRILEELGVSKEDCLYVGDSEVDIATGNAAGVVSVGVSWGFRNRQLLEEAGAQHIIDQPKELLNYV